MAKLSRGLPNPVKLTLAEPLGSTDPARAALPVSRTALDRPGQCSTYLSRTSGGREEMVCGRGNPRKRHRERGPAPE
jgi:hypothetical protein